MAQPSKQRLVVLPIFRLSSRMANSSRQPHRPLTHNAETLCDSYVHATWNATDDERNLLLKHTPKSDSLLQEVTIMAGYQ